VIDRDSEIGYRGADNRHIWIQVISGSVELDGRVLSEGDGAALSGVEEITLTGLDAASDVLLFDLG